MTSEKKEVETKLIKKIKRVPMLTTDLFKNSLVAPPDIISQHHLFKTPTPVKKIFPSIGLNNCKEECSMTAPTLDLKRPDNFVLLLVRQMHTSLLRANEELAFHADRMQILFSDAESDKKIDEMFALKLVIEATAKQLDSRTTNLEKIVQNVSGKIALKLHQDIVGSNGKVLHKKDVSFFTLFSKFKEKFREWGVPNFIDLEQTKEFKTFNTENIPNKKYSIIFSSDGLEGAWDLATMSMRGIKSCQSWHKEYPRCLIGSIVSKYIGIIYLTSGADFEGYGTRMVRRCIVRYAIDGIERTPVILLDKMYSASGQEYHEETAKVFIDFLKTKTKYPVYYAPNLKSKVRQLYTPFEKIRDKVSEKEWSYQDTPIKTNLDLQLHVLSTSSSEEYTRYVSGFQTKLVSVLSESYRTAFANGRHSNQDVYRLAATIRIDGGYDRYSDLTIRDLFNNVHIEPEASIRDPKQQFRRYLVKFILQKNNIKKMFEGRIAGMYPDFTFTVDARRNIVDFIWQEISRSIKRELSTAFN